MSARRARHTQSHERQRAALCCLYTPSRPVRGDLIERRIWVEHGQGQSSEQEKQSGTVTGQRVLQYAAAFFPRSEVGARQCERDVYEVHGCLQLAQSQTSLSLVPRPILLQLHRKLADALPFALRGTENLRCLFYSVVFEWRKKDGKQYAAYPIPFTSTLSFQPSPDEWAWGSGRGGLPRICSRHAV